MRIDRSFLRPGAVIAIAALFAVTAQLYAPRRGPDAGWGVDWLADALWLRLSLAWEKRDEVAVRRWIPVVLAAAPGEARYRIDAARMLAHDLPAWRVAAEPYAPRAVVAAWRREGVREARFVLASGDSDDALLWIEAGMIELRAGADPARAAACFRRAAELPGAPDHAARMHARLLAAMGRGPEASLWLRAWLERLPPDRARAARKETESLLRLIERCGASGPEPL